MRNKLIELIDNNKACDREIACCECEYYDITPCFAVRMADALIANGVTFAEVTDNNVGKWRQIKLCVPKGKGQTRMVWRCSKCHTHKKVRSPFCPECGFPMEMEGE